MQTRLTELRYLLYDFVGVVVFFGTITFASVQLLRYYAQSLKGGNVHNVFHIEGLSHRAIILLEWVLIFSSFIVGMIKDVGLGLRILGYGTAGVTFLYLLDVVPKFWILDVVTKLWILDMLLSYFNKIRQRVGALYRQAR
jgi:hypothetical protein